MKKLSKRYAGYLVRKSMRYVADHPADFIRLGIMSGIVLSSGDTCMASKASENAASGFDKVMDPISKVKDFVVGPLGGVLTIGGIICVGTGLVKGENRDLVGKGLGATGGGAVIMNADDIVTGVQGCLM